MSSVVRATRLILITIIALFGLLFSFLDSVGELASITELKPLENLIKNFPLIVLSLIAIELVWERFETLNRLDNFLNRVEEAGAKISDAENIIRRVSLFIENLESISYIDKLNDIYSAFVNFEKRFSQVNAFFYVLEKNERFQYLALKYGLRRLTKIIDEETIKVYDYNETLDTWRECILESSEWYAASYAKNAWGLGDGFGDRISFDYQRLRMETGGDIRRVFIVDDMDEYERLKSVMKKQSGIKVNVRWVLRDNLEKLRHVTQSQKELGTWDLSLVDNQKWTFMFNLDTEKNINGCTISMRPDIVYHARVIFQEAWEAGNSFNTDQFDNNDS